MGYFAMKGPDSKLIEVRHCRISANMYTVIETPTYQNKVIRILTEAERDSFAVFIANNPSAGSVVPGSGGIRKVRWARDGRGKSGSARIIYFNRLASGEIWLLTIYAKSERGTIPAHELRLIKEAIDHG
jgi:hypothetical protein